MSIESIIIDLQRDTGKLLLTAPPILAYTCMHAYIHTYMLALALEAQAIRPWAGGRFLETHII